MNIKKTIKFSLWIILAVFISVEMYLRYFQGFCDAPLYIESEKFEYINAPNQEGERFGNKYYYNSFSQRNKELDKKKIKVLGLGDSVIAGGVLCDQDSIATSIISNESKKIQILNISSGSWGPDNCAAYLKKYGTFNAVKMFLVASSHDAYDVMDFKPVVGIHKSNPKDQYRLAWIELFDRYVLPRLSKKIMSSDKEGPDQKVLNGIGINKNGKTFNKGFDELKSISDSLSIPLVIYLHADKLETTNKEYNSQGLKIIEWANKNKVELIKEIDFDFNFQDYRDGIHLSDKGQRKLSNIIKDKVL